MNYSEWIEKIDRKDYIVRRRSDAKKERPWHENDFRNWWSHELMVFFSIAVIWAKFTLFTTPFRGLPTRWWWFLTIQIRDWIFSLEKKRITYSITCSHTISQLWLCSITMIDNPLLDPNGRGNTRTSLIASLLRLFLLSYF